MVIINLKDTIYSLLKWLNELHYSDISIVELYTTSRHSPRLAAAQ